ncbi:MAG: hypothetical protein B7Z08_07875 [Sphingomonadales bacterium 32-68-7]|nr:MAG: hypothetical protein B7Z33_09880 [Sphingomonadales bacterium 12-68-11]OYX08788.1 MAG: hypothetical protein B7Z08_07875 [Sphingomonadales bacterium 32-68-7]
MSRPLVVTDCDEVLLHFMRHFRDWLGEHHAIAVHMERGFRDALRHADSDEPVSEVQAWDLLNGFFEGEMARQTPIDGALAAMLELQRSADVVVLTNIADRFNAARRAQLAALGLETEVFTNQGPKGAALKRIVDRFAPSRAVFIDDLAHHHVSAADLVPGVFRLHLCGEPALAPHVPCALQSGHAHARIDSWADALPWLTATLQEERP